MCRHDRAAPPGAPSGGHVTGNCALLRGPWHSSTAVLRFAATPAPPSHSICLQQRQPCLLCSAQAPRCGLWCLPTPPCPAWSCGALAPGLVPPARSQAAQRIQPCQSHEPARLQTMQMLLGTVAVSSWSCQTSAQPPPPPPPPTAGPWNCSPCKDTPLAQAAAASHAPRRLLYSSRFSLAAIRLHTTQGLTLTAPGQLSPAQGRRTGWLAGLVCQKTQCYLHCCHGLAQDSKAQPARLFWLPVSDVQRPASPVQDSAPVFLDNTPQHDHLWLVLDSISCKFSPHDAQWTLLHNSWLLTVLLLCSPACPSQTLAAAPSLWSLLRGPYESKTA